MGYCTSIKYVKSEYKHVSGMEKDQKTAWVVDIKGYGRNGFKTEKEAAIAVDKILISKGKEPVNVLKRVQKNPTK